MPYKKNYTIILGLILTGSIVALSAALFFNLPAVNKTLDQIPNTSIISSLNVTKAVTFGDPLVRESEHAQSAEQSGQITTNNIY